MNALSQRAADNDACESPNSAGSKVTFDAISGTTYKIAVASGSGFSRGTFTLKLSSDGSPPKVVSVTPANNATQVVPGAKVKATFSEAMKANTINANTFKLRKQGKTTSIAAEVTYDPATKKAILDPNANLQPGATYVATVTTGTKDLAGNRLDQDSNTPGNQQKVWKFTVQP